MIPFIKRYLPTYRESNLPVERGSSYVYGRSVVKQTAVVKRDAHNLFRIKKIILEAQEYRTGNQEQLVKSIKTLAKQLIRFLLIFLVYVCFGTFLFFYIEECTGASTANDSSILTDQVSRVTFKNLNVSCGTLFMEFQNSLNETSRTNSTSTGNSTLSNNTLERYNESSFISSIETCKDILKKSVFPYVVDKKAKRRLCSVNKFQVLRYIGFTIFTLLTIGYGNTKPITILGRSLLIVYAMFGIPIAVAMYSIAGKLTVQLFTYVIIVTDNRILKRETDERYIHLKVLFLSIFLIFLIMLIGCSVTMQNNMENWTFSTSLYFWFISLTSIGFGDINFDHEKQLASPHLLVLCLFTILFGLAVSATIIEAFARFLKKNKKTVILQESDDIDNKEELHKDVGHILLQLGLFSVDNIEEDKSEEDRSRSLRYKRHHINETGD